MEWRRTEKIKYRIVEYKKFGILYIRGINETKFYTMEEIKMKLLIQRVREASVTVDGEVTGSVGHGFLVFVGVAEEDTTEIADKMIDKMVKLRIFEDENGKTNKAIADVGGNFLVVSQFTLYADCRKGNRPSFVKAGNPKLAEELYEYVLKSLRDRGFEVGAGVSS